MTSQILVFPTNDGKQSFVSGSTCQSGERAEVQLFVYTVDAEGYYSQQKVARPHEYILSPLQNVPNGDCLIVEFGASKDRTDKLCRSYQVAEKIGKLKGERINGN